MALDGSTLTLEYPDDELYDLRCRIVKPRDVFVGGLPEGRTWSVAHTNWPYHWKRSYSIDEPEIAGRLDRDMVFTIDRLYFPIDTDIDQDYWIQDQSYRANGHATTFTGKWLVARGNTMAQELPESPQHAWLIVMCSMEGKAPPEIIAAV